MHSRGLLCDFRIGVRSGGGMATASDDLRRRPMEEDGLNGQSRGAGRSLWSYVNHASIRRPATRTVCESTSSVWHLVRFEPRSPFRGAISKQEAYLPGPIGTARSLYTYTLYNVNTRVVPRDEMHRQARGLYRWPDDASVSCFLTTRLKRGAGRCWGRREYAGPSRGSGRARTPPCAPPRCPRISCRPPVRAF